jgi:hypothetical protein
VSHASFSFQQPTLYYKHENYQLSEVKLKHNKRSEAKSFARTVAFSERFRHDFAQGRIAAHVAPSLPRRMVMVVVVVPLACVCRCAFRGGIHARSSSSRRRNGKGGPYRRKKGHLLAKKESNNNDLVVPKHGHASFFLGGWHRP